jgi:hypothetical protein
MKFENVGKPYSMQTLLCQLQYNVLLFGGEVYVLLKEQAASKAVYPVDGGTSCLQNHGTYLLSYTAAHATTSQCWVTTIRTSNLSNKLSKFMADIWGSLWGLRYNMWGSHSAAHWRELKSSEMWHCVTEYARPAFCWTTMPSVWGLGSAGRKLNAEDRGPSIAVNVSNYTNTYNDATSHVTLHSCRP